MNPPHSSPMAKPLDISIAGETNLDLILYGLPASLPTERELLGSSFNLTLGGSSSILAHNLSFLGTHVGFTSQVGSDDMGNIACARLAEAGLDTSHITRKTSTGTGVTILLPHGRERHILTYPGVMAEMTVADLDLPYLSSARHFHLSSLFLQTGLHPGLPGLFDQLRKSGLTLSLDTNDDPSGNWDGVLNKLLDNIDLLLPNEDEIKKIAVKSTLDGALDALAQRVPLIVVKCGPRGSLVQQRTAHGIQRDWAAPLPVDPIDTIGAGDSFNAGFLHAWLRDRDPLRSAAFGNITAALSTLRPGGTEAFRDTNLRTTFLQQDTLPGL